MKNIFFFLFMIVLFSVITKAQIYHNVSFKVGYVSSNVSHSFENETKNNFSEARSGFLFSVSKEFESSNLFSLIPCLQYSQKGFNEKWIQTNESGTVKEGLTNTKLDYLSLIFLAKLKYENPIIIPYLSVGPRLDFLLNKENGMIELTTGSIKSFWADKFSRWSYGVSIIVGIEYKLFDDNDFILEGSFNPDISDLLRDSSLKDFMKMKNNTFDIGLGIKL